METKNEEITIYPEYEGLSAADLARAMSQVQLGLEEITETKKKAQARYDHLRLNKLPNTMEQEGIDLFKLDGVGRITLTADMWISTPAIRKLELFQWLRDTGHEGIIKEDISSSTLKALLKELMVKGESMPGNFVKITPYTRASITRTKE